MEMPKILSTFEVAQILKCSTKTVARRAKEGKLVRVGTQTKTHYYTRDSVIAMLGVTTKNV